MSIHKNWTEENLISNLFTYSDASDTGLASIYKGNGELCKMIKKTNFISETKSSTWCELEAIRCFLQSMKKPLKNKYLKWHPGN